MVQLALRVEKLTSERMSQGRFEKRKGLGFMSGQSSKKSRSSNSFGNSFRFGTGSVSSPQTTRSPQLSRLGTSPSSFTFRRGSIPERCPYCQWYHSRPRGMPQ